MYDMISVVPASKKPSSLSSTPCVHLVKGSTTDARETRVESDLFPANEVVKLLTTESKAERKAQGKI